MESDLIKAFHLSFTNKHLFKNEELAGLIFSPPSHLSLKSLNSIHGYPSGPGHLSEFYWVTSLTTDG